MDYIILSSLAGVTLPRVVITYDIGCQWSKNFRRRMAEFPEDLRLDSSMSVEVGIPSWHINGHGDDCKDFCLHYMNGVGRTCGEEVETAWAQTNALGTSIREMGPGARHETLNDHWSGSNFRKIVGFREFNFIFAAGCLLIESLGSSFLKRLKEAYAMREKHRLIFQQFSSTFPPQTVQQWEKVIVEWENDKTKPNPYKERASSSSYCFPVIYASFTPILSHDSPRCSTRLSKRGSG
jgi:Kyakuja-Dileera-Zisupton transposase